MALLSKILIVCCFLSTNSSKEDCEYTINNFCIFNQIDSISNFINKVGEPDFIISDKSINEEFGYEIYELIYGKSTIIISDHYISDFWIRDSSLNFNKITYGSSISDVRLNCKKCSNDFLLNFSCPESTLSIDIDNKKVNLIMFSVF